MAKQQSAKRSGRFQRVIHGILVPFAMALSAAAFATGLYAQAGLGVVSSSIGGITLFLVMLCAQSAYVGSQRAAYAVERLNALESAVSNVGGTREDDGARFAQMVELTDKVGQIDELAERMAHVETLSETVERLNVEVTRTQPDRALMDPTRIQRLGAEIDRLSARQEALRTQLQIESRERFDEVSAELKVLETLVKQIAENVATNIQPLIEQKILQELPAPPQRQPEPEETRSDEGFPAEAPIVEAGAAVNEAARPETGEKMPEPSQQPDEVGEITRTVEETVADEPAQDPVPAPDPPAPGVAAQATNFEPPVDELPIMNEVRQSIESNRIELFLQPIMTLPQRRVRYYEALTRLRGEDGSLILPNQYLAPAERAGVMPVIDNVMLYRSVQVLRRLEARSTARGVFCNISAHSLLDAEFFPEFITFMDQNRSLAERMHFEFSQSMIENCTPVEEEGIAALADIGFRFSLDQVTDLDLDFQAVQERGFRYIKVDADLLLHGMTEANAQIHAADMRSYLERFNIQLIVTRIENEQMLADVLDYHVKLGQGYLFSEPRPVRPEVFEAAEAEAAA